MIRDLLIYAFVYSFPIPPLDGKDIWDFSRLLWFAVWSLCIIAFVLRLPEVIYGIL